MLPKVDLHVHAEADARLDRVLAHQPGAAKVDWTPPASAQARFILRDVRHAINQYRDARREGLARARNQLIWTGLITGLLAYSLLAFAVLVAVPYKSLIAGLVFFLVGAVVGLFDQLRVSTATESGTEDFGLGQARLFYTPVLSGLAAIGGVLITAMLYASLSGPLLTFTYPTPSATPDASAGGNALNQARSAQVDLAPPRLDQNFDLEDDRFGLVIAAVFGLTPSLLVARLQGQADRYKADLQSTSADTAIGTVTTNP